MVYDIRYWPSGSPTSIYFYTGPTSHSPGMQAKVSPKVFHFISTISFINCNTFEDKGDGVPSNLNKIGLADFFIILNFPSVWILNFFLNIFFYNKRFTCQGHCISWVWFNFISLLSCFNDLYRKKVFVIVFSSF